MPRKVRHPGMYHHSRTVKVERNQQPSVEGTCGLRRFRRGSPGAKIRDRTDALVAIIDTQESKGKLADNRNFGQAQLRAKLQHRVFITHGSNTELRARLSKDNTK